MVMRDLESCVRLHEVACAWCTMIRVLDGVDGWVRYHCTEMGDDSATSHQQTYKCMHHARSCLLLTSTLNMAAMVAAEHFGSRGSMAGERTPIRIALLSAE